MKAFFVCLLTVISFQSFAQDTIDVENLIKKITNYSLNKQKDSLIKYNNVLLKYTKKDTNSYYYNIALLNDANINRYIDKYAEKKANSALQKLKDFNNEEHILKGYNTLSQINYFKGKFDIANLYNDSIIQFIDYRKEFENITKERKYEFLVAAYSNYAGNLNYQGKYEEALKKILTAKQFSDSVKRISYPEIDIGIGILNTALSRHKEARNIYRKLIYKYKNNKKKNILAWGYSSLAESFTVDQKNDSALIYYKKAKDISLEINDYQGIVNALMFIGKIQNDLGNQLKAENNLKEALAICQNKGIEKIELEVLSELAKVYFKKNNHSLAIETFLKVVNTAKQNKRLPIIRDNYELLAKTYSKQKNYKKALFYNKLFNDLKDSIQNAEIKKNTEELLLKYETEKKEKENLILKQESSEKDLTISNKNNYILFGSLVFLFIIVLLVSYQLKKIKKKNDDLKKSIIKRQKLEKELEKVRENIAKDFHDGMGNKLARINVLSDYLITNNNLKLHKLKEALKGIKEDSDVLFKETRDFIFSLNTKSDYLEEIVTYISDFGEDFFKSFNIDFYIEKKINTTCRLPYYWNRQIILIFKEAMTNVAKHSDASEVYLIILQNKNLLSISLKDNGKGFEIDKLTKKNGLKNIQQRANKIGANVFFENKNGFFEVKFEAKIKQKL